MRRLLHVSSAIGTGLLLFGGALVVTFKAGSVLLDRALLAAYRRSDRVAERHHGNSEAVSYAGHSNNDAG